MLLGYIDRLFSKDFAYTYEGNSVFMKGLLKNKKVTCISTMKGPTGYLRLFLYNMNQVIMKKAVFNVVGIKDVKFFEFGSMETKKNKQEKKPEQGQALFSDCVISKTNVNGPLSSCKHFRILEPF